MFITLVALLRIAAFFFFFFTTLHLAKWKLNRSALLRNHTLRVNMISYKLIYIYICINSYDRYITVYDARDVYQFPFGIS